MGRPKKIEPPAINTPKENLMDRMLIDSLSRYEKTMAEFIPVMQQLINGVNILINRPILQDITSLPQTTIVPTAPHIIPIDSGTQPIDSGTIPQITGDLSDRQVWYFTAGGGSLIPAEFIKQQYGKEKWQDLTKEQAIKLIGEWKNRGEKYEN